MLLQLSLVGQNFFHEFDTAQYLFQRICKKNINMQFFKYQKFRKLLIYFISSKSLRKRNRWNIRFDLGLFFGRIGCFMIWCLALLLHACFDLFMAKTSSEISCGCSTCFSLLKVIAFTCSLRFISALLDNDPWGLPESKLAIWTTWTSRFQMEVAWFFREVSVFIINCGVFNGELSESFFQIDDLLLRLEVLTLQSIISVATRKDRMVSPSQIVNVGVRIMLLRLKIQHKVGWFH